MGSSFSSIADVISGVPQGTILGPILFIIFVSDISRNVSSHVSSYADDSKVSKSINNITDRTVLQDDLNQIYEWSEVNKMKFNLEKLELLKFRGSNKFPEDHRYLTSEGSEIKSVVSSKDLGIYFENDGTFESHIDVKCAKARKISGYIMRTFKSRKSCVILHLFKSLVLPIIEYGSIIWSPYKLCEIRKIEQIQRQFTSKLEDGMELNYWERLKQFKLYSLERRRERYLILYVFKILKGLVPNPGLSWDFNDRRGLELLYPPVNRGGLRRFQTLKHHSFFMKAVRTFNCLPHHLRCMNWSADMCTVKSLLDKFLTQVPDEPRLSDYNVSSRSASNEIVEQIRCL